jgi:type III secretory pathway component EscR
MKSLDEYYEKNRSIFPNFFKLFNSETKNTINPIADYSYYNDLLQVSTVASTCSYFQHRYTTPSNNNNNNQLEPQDEFLMLLNSYSSSEMEQLSDNNMEF